MVSSFSCACWPFLYLFKSFVHFNQVVFLLLYCRSSLYTYYVYKHLIRYMICKYLPLNRPLFILLCMEAFNFDAVQFIYFYFCCLCFWCPSSIWFFSIIFISLKIASIWWITATTSSFNSLRILLVFEHIYNSCFEVFVC